MARKPESFVKLEEFKKRIQISDKLGLDDRDNIILSLIQKDSNISQEQIAAKIKLSQPSVGARLKRLKEKGVLSSVHGVNFKVVDLQLGKIDINATDTLAVISEFKDCPFFVNGLVTSGPYNLCLFFTATDLACEW